MSASSSIWGHLNMVLPQETTFVFLTPNPHF
jgi:hypothetical protein